MRPLEETASAETFSGATTACLHAGPSVAGCIARCGYIWTRPGVPTVHDGSTRYCPGCLDALVFGGGLRCNCRRGRS